MSDTLTLDLFEASVPGDPTRRKSQTTVSRLLQEIAACREDILRKESFVADLETRLRGELDPLVDQISKTRLETFRILVGHVQAGRLRKRSREALIEVLCEFADELAGAFGFDVEPEMRSIVPKHEIEEVEDFLSTLFEEFEASEAAARPEIPDGPAAPGEDPAPGRRGRKPHGAKSKSALKREAEDASLAGEIRALYLLLARALHPDKESNPARVAEKTAWMQQVTSAYQARDLGRLLDILARNPLDAVGPYLSQAPAKTVQGFAKRLRRELEALRKKALQVGEHYHPLFAGFVRKGRVNEAEYRRYQGELKQQVRFFQERRDAYREVESVMEMLGLLKQLDWRQLM